MDAASASEFPAILDICFGTDRQLKIAYRFRDGVPPCGRFCLVAHAFGELIGGIQYWPCQVAGVDARLLGPIAVLPAWRGRGAARALVNQSMDMVARAGVDLVVLIGDAALYRQYGFTPASAQGLFIADENPERVQMRPLTQAGAEASGEVATAAKIPA